MQLQRTMALWTAAAALFMGATVANGCGSDFGETGAPGLSISSPQGLELRLPDDEDRPQTQVSIELRSTGSDDLTVTEVSLLNTPSRIQLLGERGGQCSSDADCGDGICFPANGTCGQLGGKPTPFDVIANTIATIDLVILKGPREINCGEAPEGTPSQFVEGYCGELRVATNAVNSGGFVEEGAATFYLLAPQGSGQISVNPSFLEFLGVSQNYTDSRSFTVSNDGQQPLTLNGISVEDRSNLFEISPSNFPLTIEPGTAETFDLTLSVGGDEVNLNFDTDLNFDSSAANVAPFLIRVSEGEGASPRIVASPQALVFDQETTQPLTIENIGEATLTVNSLTVQPAAVRDFYSFEVGGQPFASLAIPSGETRTIDVVFTRPGGNIEDAVGQLQIGHNDRSSGNRTTITLLGDAGAVPVGEILPASATFLSAVGEMDTRQFVIRNVGAAPLEITGVDFNFTGGTEAEFVINGATGTIAPGDFTTASLVFTGANDTPDTGEAVFTSNNGGGDLVLPILSNSSNSSVTPVITNLVQGDVRVGGTARLSGGDTTPATATKIWVLLERPAGSETFGYLVGNDFSFVPDTAGTYTVGMTAVEGSREVQTTAQVTVIE